MVNWSWKLIVARVVQEDTAHVVLRAEGVPVVRGGSSSGGVLVPWKDSGWEW